MEYIYPNGNIYKGDFLNNKRHGKGILISKDKSFFYEGDFVNDVAEGFGFFRWPDGKEYEGEFKNNLPNGFGKKIFSKREKYEGEFIDGLPNGKGIYTTIEGVLECTFVNGKANGEGIFKSIYGETQIGTYVDGKKEGTFTFIFPNGRKKEIFFYDDKTDTVMEALCF